MSKDDLQKLAEKILCGTATEEEILFYERILNRVESEGLFSDNISPKEFASLEAAIKKAVYTQTGLQNSLRTVWMRRLSVAAIFLLVAVGGYFFFLLPNPKPTATVRTAKASRFKNDVMPGREGAVLTLSNGQTIVLDSAANGTLTTQGSAQIIKQGQQIIYDANNKGGEVVYNTMSTPRGRQFHLTLSDGTEVWLNAASSITYPTAFSAGERKVKITGEVYFEVAHNENAPFEVQKDSLRVQVLGTHFNMNTYDDEAAAKVTLLQGAVRVTAEKNSGLLSPGQQAQIQNKGIRINNDVNLDEVMAWKDGVFRFQGASIEALMRQLARWYDVEIEYNKKVPDRFYADIPRDTRLSDALKALELTGTVHFGIDGKKIIVMP